MPVNAAKDAQDAILAKIAARHQKQGGGSAGRAFHRGDEEPPIARISTGSPMLDFATGGGIPIGRWTRMYGGYSSGKSLTGWNVIKIAQEMGLSCVYYNIEKQYHRDFTEAVGVDIKKLLVVEGSRIEEICENLQALLGSYHVHILDSTSKGVPNQFMTGTMDDIPPMAAKARAWGLGFDRCSDFFDHNENVVIYMDHIRDSFGTSGVHPPGGHQMEHDSSLTLFFRRGSWLFYDSKGRLKDEGEGGQSMSGGTEADGIEISVRVEKSRVCRPFRTAQLRYEFEGARIDVPWELAKAANYLDVDGRPAHRSGKDKLFGKSGNWYQLPFPIDGLTNPDGKVNGEGQLAASIEGSVELQEYVLGALRRGY